MPAGYAGDEFFEPPIAHRCIYIRWMRILIVYAHPEPGSFNGAMFDLAKRKLSRAGHEVRMSDLHAMEFDPVSDRRNFITVANPDRLDQQAEELFASAHEGFAPDVAAEIEKLIWCDVLILQFPVWWMGMPAIMKGWIDRIFALGVAYGGGRWFDRGRMAGKSAMLALTVGGDRRVYSEGGMYGSIEIVTHALHHGVLGFAGFSVIEPFVVYGPGRMTEAQRRSELDRYAERLAGLAEALRLSTVQSAGFERNVA